MPFEMTVAGDVFQCKLDQFFGHIKQAMVKAEDIMIVGTKPNPNNHDQAFNNLA